MTHDIIGDPGDFVHAPVASAIDQLLSDEVNRQRIRQFFLETDADYDDARQKGFIVGTVENRPVPGYRAAIDERGLVVEVTSAEKRPVLLPPAPDHDDWSGTAIATGFLRRAAFGTIIYASLIDLQEDSKPERIGLNPTPDGSNQANRAINTGNLYRFGGPLFLFGAKERVSIEVKDAMTEMAEAIKGKAGGELLEARRQATESLRTRGVYLLAAELLRPNGPTEKGTIKFLDSPTEDFSEARARNGFEL